MRHPTAWYGCEGPDSYPMSSPVGTLRRVEVGRVLSWEQYRARAEQEGGRLPTTAELRAEGVDVGYDQWTPVTATDADEDFADTTFAPAPLRTPPRPGSGIRARVECGSSQVNECADIDEAG